MKSTGWMMAICAAAIAGSPVGIAAQDLSKGSWIDLTHAFSDKAIYWPTADEFKRTTAFEGQTGKGYYYCAYNFSAAEHGGTHIDAPVHFAEGRKSVDQIAIDQLVGPAVVIDVKAACAKNRDYQVGVADFEAWEKTHGRLPDGCMVLLNTGSSHLYPDKKTYMGTDERGEAAVARLHFPGLHPDAAKWLVKNRSIKAIGLDTPSIDYGQSTLFESHRVLFDKNVPALENVANVDAVPVTGATLFVFPMKIEGGSGGPARIAAFVPN
jgi:kynurenine formamidase